MLTKPHTKEISPMYNIREKTNESSSLLYISFRYDLLYRNLVDTCLMAATFELGSKELFHNGRCSVGIDKATRHNKNVSIVVQANEMSNLGHPAQACTYTLMLVQRHRDSFTTTANSNTRIALPMLYSLCKGVSKIGIITTSITMGTEVFVLPSLSLKPLLYIFFQFITSMVAGKSY